MRPDTATTPPQPVSRSSVLSAPESRGWLVLFFAAWTVLALMHGYGRVLYPGTRAVLPLDHALILSLVDMYSWALVALAAFWTAQKLPWRREHWIRDCAIHFAVALAIILARAFGTNTAMYLVGIGMLIDTAFLARVMPFNIPLYTAMLGAGYAIRYGREIRERDVRDLQVQAQLTAAQMQALRMQMQPHFLFNTLNSVVALIRSEPAAAERMVVDLSEMLRASLRQNGEAEVTLDDELALLSPYLDIERTRFGDRLAINLDVPEELGHALVPQLSLQVLIENAIRHGLAPRRGRGRIDVRAERRGDILRLVVQDDGIGAESYSRSGGVGLSNLRTRLEMLYGSTGQVTINRSASGGTVAVITAPFRRAHTRSKPARQSFAPARAGASTVHTTAP